jgi:hypothetical protein
MVSLIHQISWVGRVSHDCSHCAVESWQWNGTTCHMIASRMTLDMIDTVMMIVFKVVQHATIYTTMLHGIIHDDDDVLYSRKVSGSNGLFELVQDCLLSLWRYSLFLGSLHCERAHTGCRCILWCCRVRLSCTWCNSCGNTGKEWNPNSLSPRDIHAWLGHAACCGVSRGLRYNIVKK